MKKLAFLLAMIICVVPVLGACGMHSSPEKVATAAFEAKYIDHDCEDYFETDYTLNLKLLEEVMGGKENYDALQESMRKKRNKVEEEIKSIEKSLKESEEIKDYKVDYDIRYMMEYRKGTELYDMYLALFEFKDTEVQDLIKKVAVVGIAAEVYLTNQDKNESVRGNYVEIVCYNIDGDWYVAELD